LDNRKSGPFGAAFFIHTLNTLRTAKPVDIEIHQDFIETLDKIQVRGIVVVLFSHRDVILREWAWDYR
jgi:hypothetical protein